MLGRLLVSTSSTYRTIFVLLALATGGLLLWSFRAKTGPGEASRAPVAANPPPAPPAPETQPRAARPSSAGFRETVPFVGADGRLVGRIFLNKTEVCPGEQIEVEVVPEPGIEEPTIFVGPDATNPAVVSYPRAGRRSLSVGMRSANALHAQSVDLVVKENCPPDVPLELRYSLDTDRDAALFQLDGPRKSGTEVVWDFGDGTIARTASAAANHSYVLRPQNATFSTFLATATAVAPNGERVTRKIAVRLTNTYYYANRGPTKVLPVEYDRFPVVRSSELDPKVRIGNVLDTPVRFTEVAIRGSRCKDDHQVDPREKALVGLPRPIEISPGGTFEGSIPLTTAYFDDPVCVLYATLHGTTGPGQPAQASLLLDFGAPKTGKRVTDPALVEKIHKAQKLLGRTQVTPDDLRRLEAERAL
jgi:hypothetical protein